MCGAGRRPHTSQRRRVNYNPDYALSIRYSPLFTIVVSSEAGTWTPDFAGHPVHTDASSVSFKPPSNFSYFCTPEPTEAKTNVASLLNLFTGLTSPITEPVTAKLTF